MGEEYRGIAEITGSTVQASAAVVFDWQAGWAAEQPATPTVDFSYRRNVLAIYRALWRAGITVDVVAPSAELDRYGLVVVPTLHMVSDADAQRLLHYVEGGGHALVTWFSGIVDEHAQVRLGGYPGAFRDLLGVRAEEFFPLLAGEVVRLDDGSTASVWTELLEARRAEVIASYLDGPLPGVPAVTTTEYGKGRGWYIACGLDDVGMERVVRAACERARVRPVVDAPTGVEVVRRRGERAGAAVSWLFAINHTDEDVVLPVSGVELLSGLRVDAGGLTVSAGDVVVVREEV
jgi:beta-galactosidase